MSNLYLINTRQKAEQALRQQKLAGETNQNSDLMPARIVAVNGDGYDVATVDASGEIGRIYERIFPHPVDSTLAVDDEVWLWVPGDGETPVIMVSGGGSSACYVSTIGWGTLWTPGA